MDCQVDGEKRTQEPLDLGRQSKEARHAISNGQWLPDNVDALPTSATCAEHALPSAVRCVSGPVTGAEAPGLVVSCDTTRAGEGRLDYDESRPSEDFQRRAALTQTGLLNEGPQFRIETASFIHCPVEDRMNDGCIRAFELETHGPAGEAAGQEQASLVREVGDSPQISNGILKACASSWPLMDDAVANVAGVICMDNGISSASASAQNSAVGMVEEGMSYADAVIAGIKMVEPGNEAVQLAELATTAGTSIEGLLDFNYTATPNTGMPQFCVLGCMFSP